MEVMALYTAQCTNPPSVEMKPVNTEARYKRIKVEERTPGFGAWIRDIDLTCYLDTETKRELRDALFEFGVIFFSPQELSDSQMLDLADVFGNGLAPQTGLVREADRPTVEFLTYDRELKFTTDLWHTDSCWVKEPPLGQILQMMELPPVGGGTNWLSMSKAYERLSAPTKSYLDQLTGVHSWEMGVIRTMRLASGYDEFLDMVKRYPPVEHPLVMRHPITGRKAIYCNEVYTIYIKDLHQRESDSMLRVIYDWVKQPEFILQHKWEKGEIVVWDLYSTLHYGSNDFWPWRRVLRRLPFKL